MPNTRKRGRKDIGGGAFKPRPAHPVLPASRVTVEDLWAEISDLRMQMNELRASSLPPKFAHFNLDGIGIGARYFKCGFQPLCVSAHMNISTGAALTFSWGFAVFSEEEDDNLFQSYTAIRATSGAALFRANALTGFCAQLSDDNSVVDIRAQMDSLDPDGFSYTMVGSGTPDVFRGFVIGR